MWVTSMHKVCITWQRVEWMTGLLSLHTEVRSELILKQNPAVEDKKAYVDKDWKKKDNKQTEGLLFFQDKIKALHYHTTPKSGVTSVLLKT